MLCGQRKRRRRRKAVISRPAMPAMSGLRAVARRRCRRRSRAGASCLKGVGGIREGAGVECRCLYRTLPVMSVSVEDSETAWCENVRLKWPARGLSLVDRDHEWPVLRYAAGLFDD